MKVDDRGGRAWYQTDPNDGSFLSNGSPCTIVVHDLAVDTINTGLLDASGNPIHRRVTHPAGFVHFKD